MDKTVSLAKKAPLTIAMVSGIFVASYMFTGIFAESAIGRPSSTAAIGLLFAPIYSLIVAAIGYVVGLVLKFFLLKRGERDLVRRGVFIRNSLIITFVLALFSSGSAFKQVVDYEANNAPRILNNKNNFIITSYTESDIPSVTKQANLVWEFNNQNIIPTEWLNDNYVFNSINSTQMHIISGKTIKATYDFSGYTYLTKISTLPITTANGTNYLVVLARLRATAHRSMLLIYNTKFNLVYEELLDRCGRKQYIGTTNDIDGELLVVNICEPFAINVNK